MYYHARSQSLFDSPNWFNIIDSINITTMFRNHITALSQSTRIDLTSSGILQQAIHLSPFIPTQFIKLGSQGVLLVRLLPPAHSALELPRNSARIVCHGMEGSEVGGLHVSHVPGIKVPQEQIVSVNGVGDTFLGVLLARLAEVEKESRRAGKGGGLDGLRDLEEAVDLAQKAAVMTLGVREAVSAEIGSLRR